MSGKKSIVKFDNGDVPKIALFKDREGFARIQIYERCGLLIQAQATKIELNKLSEALKALDYEM